MLTPSCPVLPSQGAVRRRLAEAGESFPELWTAVYKLPFVDTDRSRSPYRAFYVPFLGDRFMRFGDYTLLRRGQGGGQGQGAPPITIREAQETGVR
jgi:hypothetical protein